MGIYRFEILHVIQQLIMSNFSAVATIEHQSIKNGTNLIFSEQNLIDCDLNSRGYITKVK